MSMLPVGIGSAEAGGYQISRSLRFNSADSAYLNRTPASAGNRKTWTWSGWVKRGRLGVNTTQSLFFAGSSNNGTDSGVTGIYFLDSNALELSTFQTKLLTTQVFRDPSAWYHIVVAVDTTQSGISNQAKLYVNGIQVTQFSTTNAFSSSVNTAVNNTVVHEIGRQANVTTRYYDGYLTEINFIDGQALTPSSFGETNPDTGVWQPKKYTGTYGTNGFYLNFSDNSGTTSTTLGKDSSGNGNNWTPNNFSVTAGAGNDSLVDTPTPYGTDTGVGGEVRGNYATLNPLANGDFGIATLTNGNLDASGSTNYFPASSTIAISTGKWYWEVLCTTREAGGNYPNIGLWVVDGWNIGSTPYTPATTGGVSTWPNGIVGTPSGNTTYTTWTTNDIVNFAYDADTGKVYVGKNGTWFNSGNPVAGTGFVYQYTAGTTLIPGGSFYSAAATYNFGQRPFAYTPPAGFLSLCTTNLPTPTILDGTDYFNTVLWTGTGGARTITGVGFQPDFVWGKGRSGSATYPNLLWDAVRGTNLNLVTNNTAAEFNAPSASSNGGLGTSVSDGFTIVAGTSTADNLNALSPASTYVAWNWKANGAGSSNTAGTITSTVSVNTTSGFSIVTYTGTGSAATVGHGLGVAPKMIIYKYRGGASSWVVGHQSFNGGVTPWNYIAYLDLTNAIATAPAAWNNTAPTSSVFSIGGTFNPNGGLMVAYCFAEVAGYSAMSSYTGNGSADGPFIFTNHRPAFVLIKRTDTTSNWTILDFQREGYNVDNDPLYPNLSNAEGTTDLADLLSNGFKLRTTDASVNASGGTYIYMSLASNPFKYSLGR